MFTIWCALLLFITYFISDVDKASKTNAAIIDAFITQQFPQVSSPKTFMDVGNQDEWWDWVQGPLAQGIYATELYNGLPPPPGEAHTVYKYMRIVGGVQLRQLRVSNSSCNDWRMLEKCRTVYSEALNGSACLPRFDSQDGTCYADFVLDETDDRSPFGPPHDPPRYAWSDGYSSLSGLFVWGPLSGYGTGGYVVELPLDPTQGLAMLEQLYNDTWTDRATRAVCVDMNLYNTQTQMLSVVRMMTEFYASGHVDQYYNLYTFKVAIYETAWDEIRRVAEVLWVVMLLYYIQKVRGCAAFDWKAQLPSACWRRAFTFKLEYCTDRVDPRLYDDCVPLQLPRRPWECADSQGDVLVETVDEVLSRREPRV